MLQLLIFFDANATTDLFSLKEKITCQTGNNGTKNVEIMVPLKYLITFWRTLEMPLIDCEITARLLLIYIGLKTV